MELASNNLQRLICHKTQQTNQPTISPNSSDVRCWYISGVDYIQKSDCLKQWRPIDVEKSLADYNIFRKGFDENPLLQLALNKPYVPFNFGAILILVGSRSNVDCIYIYNPRSTAKLGAFFFLVQTYMALALNNL